MRHILSSSSFNFKSFEKVFESLQWELLWLRNFYIELCIVVMEMTSFFFFVKWLPEKIIEHIFRYWTIDFKAKVIELSFFVMLEFYMIL